MAQFRKIWSHCAVAAASAELGAARASESRRRRRQRRRQDEEKSLKQLAASLEEASLWRIRLLFKFDFVNIDRFEHFSKHSDNRKILAIGQ